jgi:hypothetical protein
MRVLWTGPSENGRKILVRVLIEKSITICLFGEYERIGHIIYLFYGRSCPD